MNVALSELPQFTCMRGQQGSLHTSSGIVIGPTLDYLEQAYLDARNVWLVACAGCRNAYSIDH